MMFPQGNAWQALRSDCLSAIPSDTRVSYKRPSPLSEWHRRGYFRVTTSTKKEVAIESAAQEIGAALLSDAEHLLDHAAEHQATIRVATSTEGWHSPGWAIVTIYYWAFFNALALTRLVGRTVWFLDGDALRDIKRLSPTPDAPGRGIFRLTLRGYVNATDRELLLEKTGGRLHEACWKETSSLLLRLAKVANEHSNSIEYRILLALTEASRKLHPDWPSTIRNSVNYRPGCGYREVVNKTEIEVGRFLRKNSKLDISQLLGSFEDILIRIKTDTPHYQQINEYCLLLLLFTLLLNSMCVSLHEDLITRHSLDTRWLDLRKIFFRKHHVLSAGLTWPYSDS